MRFHTRDVDTNEDTIWRVKYLLDGLDWDTLTRFEVTMLLDVLHPNYGIALETLKKLANEEQTNT